MARARKSKSSFPKKKNKGGGDTYNVDKRKFTQNVSNDNRQFIDQTNIDNSVTSIDKLNVKVKEAKNSFSLLNVSMGEAGESASGLLGNMGGFTEVAKKVFDIGSSVEQTRSAFVTLTGDAAKANQIIDQTFADARSTPFDFDSLASANQLLMAVGEDANASRQHVLDLGNAVAAAGGSNAELVSLTQTLQGIKSEGQATTQDLNAFAASGINIYQALATHLGTTADKVTGMKISYSDLTGALQQARESGGLYAGAMDAANNTAAGRVGNLKDKVFELAAKMFADLQPAIMTIVGWLGAFVDWASKLWIWVSQNKDMLNFLVEALFGVVGIVYGVIQATRLWTTVQAILNTVMKMSPLGLVVTIVGALIFVISRAWKHSETFRGIVLGLWEAFKTLVTFLKDTVMKQLGAIGNILIGIFTFDKDKISQGIKDFSSVDYSKVGQEVRKSFDKGWKEGHEKQETEQDLLNPNLELDGKQGGLGDWKGTNEDLLKQYGIDPVANDKNIGGPPVNMGSAGAGAPQASAGTEKVTGNSPKQVSYTITIENLVKEFNIITTNFMDSPDRVKEFIMRALLDATNDSQLAGG